MEYQKKKLELVPGEGTDVKWGKKRSKLLEYDNSLLVDLEKQGERTGLPVGRRKESGKISNTTRLCLCRQQNLNSFFPTTSYYFWVSDTCSTGDAKTSYRVRQIQRHKVTI
jgi:hypothetical protein